MKNTFLVCLLMLFSSAANAQTKPFILGEIRELDSKILSEKRTLNVYLPEGYAENDTAKYPVIYLLDGSADEDFIHVAGLVQFCNFPWVNTIPKSIVIGIANVDRRRDFTFPTTQAADKKNNPTSGASVKFLDFIERELQPFVEKTYKTAAQKMIIGQSLGGLLATEILFKKPHLFTHYAIVSPSLWWDKESLLTVEPKILATDFTQKTQVYMAVGDEGDVMVGDAKKLNALLEKANRPHISLVFNYLGNRNHATILHEALYKAFESFKF